MHNLSIGPQTEFAKSLYKEKYCLPHEQFRDTINRVSNALKEDDEHFHILKDIFRTMRFMPAGRIQASMGSPKRTTPYNCYVSGTIEDSFVDGDGSIMQRASEAAQTMRMGGGIGYDFSTLRPNGALIKKLNSHSSGPVSFMKIFSALCECVSSSGHRRGAQMGVIRIDHPDIEEFITAKQNLTNLTGFNMSVAVTDEFMQCLQTSKPFALKFEGITHKEVDASALWEMLMRSTWDWAEPGVLFIDTINRFNNLYYCETLAATNPCVTYDTPILTSKGYINIGETIGKKIKVWNGKEFSPVTPYSTGINRIVHVQLSNGRTLKCTPEHKFLLANSKLVAAKDLKPGAKLAKENMPLIKEGHEVQSDGYSQGFYAGDGTANSNKSWIYEPKYPCIKRLRGSVGKKAHKTRHFKVWSHGPMFSKTFVPINSTLEYCIDWLSGIIDADGSVEQNAKLPSLQLTSIDEAFILNIQLMLTRLGVRAHVAKVDRGLRDWGLDVSWRLCINQTDTQALLKLGLKLERHVLNTGKVQRDARRFVTIIDVVDTKQEEETFCFTENKRGLGTFNGIVTGQCGEQPLPPFGACLLGSFNLVKYITKQPFTNRVTGYDFDFEQFKIDILPVVRALDNVIDQALYPLPQQKIEAISKRRMGIGVTGLANAIETLGFEYGSSEFLEFELKILETLRTGAYKASIQLANEKGSFPKFDTDLYLAGEHIKLLPDDIRYDIKKYGIRNSHLTSIAPTGTISLCADNTSGGIEPVFEYKSKRLVNRVGGQVVVDVEDYAHKFFNTKGKLSKYVTVQEHIEVLSVASTLVDSAVSKTCNVDNSTSWDDFKGIYIQAWERGCKGCTTFNSDGKRMGILTKSNDGDEVENPIATIPKQEYDEISAAIDQTENNTTGCYIDPITNRRDCDG